MKEKSIGLWEKTSQKGNKYYVGKMKIKNEEYTINLFKNEKGDNPKRPDYNMLVKEAKEEKKENHMSDEVFANFGNQTDPINDDDLAF